MDEQVPEERPEEAPLENKLEPAAEPQASQLDSAQPEEPQALEDETRAAEELPQPVTEPAAATEAQPMQAEPESAVEPAATESQEEVVEAVAEEKRPSPTVPSGLRGGRLQLDEAAPEASSEPAWYVIHCYSGYENKVRHNLEQRIETMGMKDRIFDVVIPTQEEIEVRDGKRRTVERHIFPGYVLVNMSLS